MIKNGWSDIHKGNIAIEREYNKKNSQQSLFAQFDALADMKFTYVISCQMFGEQKSSGDPHAQDIIDLMIRYTLIIYIIIRIFFFKFILLLLFTNANVIGIHLYVLPTLKREKK